MVERSALITFWDEERQKMKTLCEKTNNEYDGLYVEWDEYGEAIVGAKYKNGIEVDIKEFEKKFIYIVVHKDNHNLRNAICKLESYITKGSFSFLKSNKFYGILTAINMAIFFVSLFINYFF